MNPVDHPHGGGEGKTTAGRHPVTPWGVPTLGYRTRKKGKPSDKYIVRGRKPREEAVGADGSFDEEGPVGRGAPDAAHQPDERERREAHGQDLVARLDDLPRDGGPHDRGARRAQARAGVHHRVDGRPQAGRVCADARVPRPRRLGQDGEGEVRWRTRRTSRAKAAEKPSREASQARSREADGEAARRRRSRRRPRRRRRAAKPQKARKPAAAKAEAKARDQKPAAQGRRRPRSEGRGQGRDQGASAGAPTARQGGAASRPRKPAPRKREARRSARSCARRPSTCARPPARRGW